MFGDRGRKKEIERKRKKKRKGGFAGGEKERGLPVADEIRWVGVLVAGGFGVAVGLFLFFNY